VVPAQVESHDEGLVSLAAVPALAVAVLALARELGELRLAIAPQAALSLEHEGPELGSRVDLIRMAAFDMAESRHIRHIRHIGAQTRTQCGVEAIWSSTIASAT
jgi:hypothetical protein